MSTVWNPNYFKFLFADAGICMGKPQNLSTVIQQLGVSLSKFKSDRVGLSITTFTDC